MNISQRIKAGVFPAILFAILSLPILGINLKMSGASLGFQIESADKLWLLLAGAVLVLLVQAFRDYFVTFKDGLLFVGAGLLSVLLPYGANAVEMSIGQTILLVIALPFVVFVMTSKWIENLLVQSSIRALAIIMSIQVAWSAFFGFSQSVVIALLVVSLIAWLLVTAVLLSKAKTFEKLNGLKESSWLTGVKKELPASMFSHHRISYTAVLIAALGWPLVPYLSDFSFEKLAVLFVVLIVVTKPVIDKAITSDLRKKILVAAIVISLVVWPFLGDRGAISLSTLVLIYVMLGLGLNVVVGLAGLLDLGFVGFYAVGAYTYGMLNHYYGLGFWTSLPLAGGAAALFGFILGFPVLRLRGDYLAIVTLGFGEIIRLMLNNLTEITGGPNGINRIDKPTLFGLEFNKKVSEGATGFFEFFSLDYSSMGKMIFIYLIALFITGVCVFVIFRLLKMPIGRAWEALREDEIACRSLGLNPTVIKLTAFTIGATTAGFAGAIFAASSGSIAPNSFIFIESAIILAIVVLGGMGSQVGVILAAIVLTVLPFVATGLDQYRMLIFGFSMVLIMVWRPQGFLPMQREIIELPKKYTKQGEAQ